MIDLQTTRSETQGLMQPDEPRRKTRYVEIDVIRGFALLTISVDHLSWLTKLLGRSGGTIPTFGSGQFFPSSMAEIFFLFSGYLFGHVRVIRNRHLQSYCLRRALKIYLCNVAVYLLCFLVMLLFGQSFLTVTGWDLSRRGAVEFATLVTAPFSFDVLQFYTIALLITPLFVLLLRRKARYATSLVVLGWIFVMTFAPTYPQTLIKTLPWLLFFFGGVVVGSFRCADGILAFATDRRFFATALVTLSLVALANVLQYHFLPMEIRDTLVKSISWQRERFGPLRIISCMCVLIVVIRLAVALQRRLPLLSAILARIGRNALEGFCLSNVLLYILIVTWSAHPTILFYHLLCLVYMTALVAGLQIWFDVGGLAPILSKWRRNDVDIVPEESVPLRLR